MIILCWPYRGPFTLQQKEVTGSPTKTYGTRQRRYKIRA